MTLSISIYIHRDSDDTIISVQLMVNVIMLSVVTTIGFLLKTL